MSSFRVWSVVVGVSLVAGLGACGSPPKPAATPRDGATGPSAAASSSGAPLAIPEDPSPNVLNDRRAEPGLRAAPKSLVLDGARSVVCGAIKPMKKKDGGQELDLLAGRLRVRPPAGSRIPEPAADAPALEEESRVVTEPAGKEKAHLSLAVVARETFQLDPDLYQPEQGAPSTPGSLDVEAPKFLKATFGSAAGQPLDISPVQIGADGAPMRAYVARPQTPNAPPGKDTALVLALLVAQDDGALESVAFYVRGEAVRDATGTDLVGCTRLAERIASTLMPGPRKLERAAGRRHVADLPPDRELALTVPADYVAIPPGAGKTGVRLTKLRPISLYPGSILVSLDAKGPVAAPEGADATAPGKLLGHAIEWRGKTTPRGGFFFAAEPLDDKSKTAAVLVKATRQEKTLNEMRAVAETLAVVERAPAH
jgi:hypothetical protein